MNEEEKADVMRVVRVSVHSRDHAGKPLPASWMSPLVQNVVEVNDFLNDEDFQQEYVLPLGGVLRGFRMAEREKNLRYGLVPVCFLVLFVVSFTLQFNSSEMFEVHNALFEELALDSIAMSKYNSPRTFMTITNWKEYWDWAETILFAKAYACCYADGTPRNISYGSYNDFTLGRYNRLITPIRFRQVRIKEDDCSFPSDVHELARPCWPGYSSALVLISTTDFSSADTNLTGDRYISGGLSSLQSDYEDGHNYGVGGHVVDLELDTALARRKLRALSDNLWTDESTRVVAVDVNMYNPNVDLATVFRLIVDQTASGQLVPSVEVCSCPLDLYDGVTAFARTFVGTILTILYLCYVGNKILKLWRAGLVKHLRNVYNMAELLYLAIFGVLIYFWTDFLFSDKEKFQTRNTTEFHDLLAVCRKSQISARLAGFTLLWSFVHAFKHFQAYRSLALTWEVLAHSMRDVLPFMAMLCLAAAAFGLAGHWAFGPWVYDFHTFSASTVLLLRSIIAGLSVSQRRQGRGEIYAQMKEAQSTFAPIWAILWIVLCTLIFFNMFIAIITNSFIFVSQRNRRLAELEEKYPMPSLKVYLKAKTTCFGCFWREPEEREQIMELVDEIETWKGLLQDFDRHQFRSKIYWLASKGRQEFTVADVGSLYSSTGRGESSRKAVSWMREVSEKAKLKMARHNLKNSTTFQIELLTDKVAKMEEEAVGLTLQLKEFLPKRLQPSAI